MPYYPPPSSSTPTGSAGGDLAGTYPNPTLNTSISTAVAFSGLGATTIKATGDALVVTGNSGAIPAGPTGTNIHLAGANSGQLQILQDGFAAAPIWATRRAQGTAQSPSALNFSNFNIGAWQASGYGTTAYSTPQTFMSLLTNEAWSDTAQGTRLQFSTTPIGATASVLALTINSSQQAVFTVGSVSLPGISFAGSTNTGVYSPNTGQVTLSSVGTFMALADAGIGAGLGGFAVNATYGLGFITATNTNPRTILNSPAPATLQLGAANAASPVAQTLQAQGSRAGTDSNIGGAGLTVTSGNGTGTGTRSVLTLQSPVAVASGTGAQTQTTGWRIDGGTGVSTSYTVATLPASPLTGARAHVTDALAPTFLAAVVGGGAIVTPVFYNGSAWIGG